MSRTLDLQCVRSLPYPGWLPTMAVAVLVGRRLAPGAVDPFKLMVLQDEDEEKRKSLRLPSMAAQAANANGGLKVRPVCHSFVCKSSTHVGANPQILCQSCIKSSKRLTRRHVGGWPPSLCPFTQQRGAFHFHISLMGPRLLYVVPRNSSPSVFYIWGYVCSCVYV